VLRYVIYTCRLHIRDMFYEIPVMASRGLVRSHSSDCIYTVISLLFYCSKDVIQFWVVTSFLGLKSVSNLRDAGIALCKRVPRRWLAGL